MEVVVEVVYESSERPPSGAPIRVEVRDTTLQDVSSVTLAEAEGRVRKTTGRRLDTVRVIVDHLASDTTVWVHIDVDGDGRVSKGDYVTMAAFQVPRDGDPTVRVAVRRV